MIYSASLPIKKRIEIVLIFSHSYCFYITNQSFQKVSVTFSLRKINENFLI